MSADNSITIDETQIKWPSCPFMEKQEEDSKPSLSEMVALMQELMAANNGIFPLLFPPEFQWVEELLKGLSVRYPVDDYFKQMELNLIFDAIDNYDYIHSVYPDAPPTCKGLLPDTGIIHAITKFKHNNENPELTEIRWVCSAIGVTVPRHLYYLTFKSRNNTTGNGFVYKMRFVSGDEILKEI